MYVLQLTCTAMYLSIYNIYSLTENHGKIKTTTWFKRSAEAEVQQSMMLIYIIINKKEEYKSDC